MAKKKEEPVIDALSTSNDSIIVTDDEIFSIELLGDIESATEFKDDVAYIDNNIFYLL